MPECGAYSREIKRMIDEQKKISDAEEAARQRRIEESEKIEDKWIRKDRPYFNAALEEGYAEKNREQNKRGKQHPTKAIPRAR